MAGIVVKLRARIFHGHEWVYGTEVKKVFGEPEPGDVISLKDYRDRSLGSAIYNPESQIVARRFSRRKQDLDLDFFQRRIERADSYRQKLGFDAGAQAYRMVWSESDGLPGLVVERYGDELAIQTLSLALDLRKDLIVEALQERFSPVCILERNDSPVRAAEGMKPITSVLQGEPRKESIDLDGVRLRVDLAEGQKTGLYLDQLDNYGRIAKLASGRKVLDCFCNQGGFALFCAKAGAESVTGVDSSAAALELAESNGEASGLAANFVEANVFDYLKEAEADTEIDLIVLDPPSFTRNRKSVRDAMRGYKEIHLRALKLLQPGGILATFCCSHHVSREEFLEVILDAAVDAKRTLRLVETYTQRRDHPVLPSLPESEYLRGFSFEVLPAW